MASHIFESYRPHWERVSIQLQNIVISNQSYDFRSAESQATQVTHLLAHWVDKSQVYWSKNISTNFKLQFINIVICLYDGLSTEIKHFKLPFVFYEGIFNLDCNFGDVSANFCMVRNFNYESCSFKFNERKAVHRLFLLLVSDLELCDFVGNDWQQN